MLQGPSAWMGVSGTEGQGSPIPRAAGVRARDSSWF